MIRAVRHCTTTLVLALSLAAAAQAAVPLAPKAGCEMDPDGKPHCVLIPSWVWLSAHSRPARHSVTAKAGCEMDPNGKPLCVLNPGP
ncbi:MAG TPA: hypothetical protein VF173_05400 [Thermoanaerobaculia bacterium]|nr:hypothetical protein [Thermoanaerobaculia bacterium]